VNASLDVVALDVTNDATIISAKEYLEKKYGRLDGSFSETRSDQTMLIVE
jgi:hypothetical protein